MKSKSRAADAIKKHEGVKESKGEVVGVRVDHVGHRT